MNLSIGPLLAAAALSALVAAPAAARTTLSAGTAAAPATATSYVIEIDLAGWQTFGGFERESNTSIFVDIGAGNTVLGFDYENLSFTTENGSLLNELTLSVNSADAQSYMDWLPSTIDSTGSTGPLSGSWGGSSGTGGPFGPGGSFSPADGRLWITVYEAFDDPFLDEGFERDAFITSGTLRVVLASPIPEPGTYAMMALGLLAIGALVRRRRQPH